MMQKSRQKSPSGHHRATLSGHVFATKAYRQSEKNLLSSNISFRWPHNMVNFGPLATEIVSLVWGNPGNFNGVRVLAALRHGTLVVGVSQTAALNRGRHLYSAGWPSRWALAHILVSVVLRLGWIPQKRTSGTRTAGRMPFLSLNWTSWHQY